MKNCNYSDFFKKNECFKGQKNICCDNNSHTFTNYQSDVQKYIGNYMTCPFYKNYRPYMDEPPYTKLTCRGIPRYVVTD